MEIKRKKVKKILIIKLRGIGDVILSTVVLENLKNDFPDAKIDYLTELPSLPALENITLINEILILKKDSLFSSIKLIIKIFLNRYDLVFDFFSNPRTALITFLSFAIYRAGFPYRIRNYAYNLKGPKERDKFHAAQLHLEFLKMIGLSFKKSNMFFGLNNDDREFANNFFYEKFTVNDKVIGLSPSGGWQSKKCDPIKFAEIGNAVFQKYKIKILILWGIGDHIDALEIGKLMNNQVTLAPSTDIRKLAALIEKCSAVIANDSGPMHIAAALNTPVLSLHGPTNPNLQGPFGNKHEFIRNESLDCIGCNLLECNRNHECFLDLSINDVLNKFDLLIRKNNLDLKLRNE